MKLHHLLVVLLEELAGTGSAAVAREAGLERLLERENVPGGNQDLPGDDASPAMLWSAASARTGSATARCPGAHEAGDPTTMPLLIDADGFIPRPAEPSILVPTPAAALHPSNDGRILPGVTASQAGARRQTSRSLTWSTPRRFYVASALGGLTPADPI